MMQYMAKAKYMAMFTRLEHYLLVTCFLVARKVWSLVLQLAIRKVRDLSEWLSLHSIHVLVSGIKWTQLLLATLVNS